MAGTPLPPLPPMQRPDAGGMADMGAIRRRRAIVLGIVVLILAGVAAAVVLASRGGDDGGSGGAASSEDYDGTVYVESNVTASNGNSILAFRYKAGSFKPLSVREYPTGGSGSADLTNSRLLDAEQQVVVNAARTLLCAVNARSAPVAGFHIADDGTLTPVDASPFAAGGRAPASVGVSGDSLFVANKAEDGVR